MVHVRYPIEMALANLRGRVLVMASYRWLPEQITRALAEERPWPTPPPGFAVPARPPEPELHVLEDAPRYWRAVDAGLYDGLDAARTVAVLDPDLLGTEPLEAHVHALRARGVRVLVTTGDPTLTARLVAGGIGCAITPDVNELGFQIGRLFAG